MSTLYNADAPQRIPLNIVSAGREFRVCHVVHPLTDADFLALADVTRKARGEKDEIPDLIGARAALWEKLVQSVEGYKPREDWKTRVKADDRIAATKALDYVNVALPEEAGDDELADFDEDRTHSLDVLFEGRVVRTTHTLQEPSADDRKRFSSLLKRAATVVKKEGEQFEQKIADFYDRLATDATGYAPGSRVPIWHKTTVVLEHFRLTGEAVEKN
jgi:hypothetical protein